MGKCHNCDQYDYTTHNCPVFCDVIRNTLDDIKADERRKIIDKIYRFIKAEGNPYGKPMIEFEETKKILRYLEQLKGDNNG